MTESLTERLRQKAATQTAESEQIISTELRKLTSGIRQQLDGDLASIQNDIAGTSLKISADLRALRWASRYWWIALGVTWLVLGGFSVWHSMRPSQMQSAPMSLADYQTFTQDGRTFLIVPNGSQVVNCLQNETTVGCVVLPEGE